MTPQEYAARMKQRAGMVEPRYVEAMDQIEVSSIKYCKEKMTAEIYSIPEDRTKKGKKKWTRTGHLRRSERAERRGPLEVAIVNDAIYAASRHEAGKASSSIVREPRNINPIRRSHWRDDLAKAAGPLHREIYRKTLVSILRIGPV